MKSPSEPTFCVVDTSGLFVPLARKLGETSKRTLYTNPAWQKGDPVINESVIGDGFPEIEWCWDAWLLKKEIDVWVFPDLQAMGMQEELRSQGAAVWGAGRAMTYETNRIKFLDTLKSLNLDVPPYTVVVGLSNLAAFLKDKTDIFIKMSKWRGSWETVHWENWDTDSHRLDSWAFKFGGLKEKLQFICFDHIETKLEIGADTYFVNTRWPSKMLHGIEKKDAAYMSSVTETNKMPEELLHIMEAFGPLLATSSQWSMEVRTNDDGDFFIDGTIRGGQPSTGSQLCSISNIAEVIAAGAHGELVEPDYEYAFTAECRVQMEGDLGSWETIVVDDKLEPFLMLSECCMVDGQVWFPAREPRVQYLGWLVASADDPKALVERMKELAGMLPQGVTADVAALGDIIKEIEQEQAEGITFTEATMPEPSAVLEES